MAKVEETVARPRAICGYPLPGWRLQSLSFDDGKGRQNDGWIVHFQREGGDIRWGGIFSVMARSSLGPLEAWDEAIEIALREDARRDEDRTRQSTGVE